MAFSRERALADVPVFHPRTTFARIASSYFCTFAGSPGNRKGRPKGWDGLMFARWLFNYGNDSILRLRLHGYRRVDVRVPIVNRLAIRPLPRPVALDAHEPDRRAGAEVNQPTPAPTVRVYAVNHRRLEKLQRQHIPLRSSRYSLLRRAPDHRTAGLVAQHVDGPRRRRRSRNRDGLQRELVARARLGATGAEHRRDGGGVAHACGASGGRMRTKVASSA